MRVFGRQLWHDRYDYLLYGACLVAAFSEFVASLRAGDLVYALIFFGCAALMAHCTLGYWRWARAWYHEHAAAELMEREKYIEAIRHWDRCARLFPKHHVYVYNRGCSYFRTGDFEAALTDFSKAVELDPGDSEYLQARKSAQRVLTRQSACTDTSES